ncbi:TraR/DksA family transcriptional regulator [Bacillus sp. REN16]|uniref:TraR/DksA family transcriptional regulator n=1 Tax=Bacillus sp. REN16 TaxID=2887296 RepID=UPI001E2E58E8|nr:TraR/DksA family transcriptional regulator [Bacillus sp. REN16]MCC3357544.1 TraR/DksA family transcriptional regulator [Bacillus sp. REN16]
MNDQYAEIKAELELTRKELFSRLMQSTQYEVSQEFLFQNQQSEKEKIVINHIKEDLNDVERALNKMNSGMFGICEETGAEIPIEKLRILPTARTIFEFSFTDLYDRGNCLSPKRENHLYLVEQK